MQEETRAPLIDTDLPAARDSEPVRPRTPLFVLFGVVAAGVLAADQLTKVWALAALTPGHPVNLLGTALRLNLIRNPGAAFSIGNNATWMLTIIAIGVLAFIGVVARRLGSRVWAGALGLLLGGAVGNLLDRLLRQPGPGRGQVVDFVDYFGLFIGNVADIAIVSAAVLVAVLAMRGIGVTGERTSGGRTSGGRHVASEEGGPEGSHEGVPKRARSRAHEADSDE